MIVLNKLIFHLAFIGRINTMFFYKDRIPKKYLIKIIILVSASMLFTMISFSIAVNINVDKNIKENEYNNAKKILYQVKYNIELMQNMVNNVSKSIFFDSDTKSIMYFDNIDDYEQMYDSFLKLKKLRSMVTITPFINSVFVYNNNIKLFYSTDNRSIFTDDKFTKDIFDKYGNVPLLEFIPVTIPPLNNIQKEEFVFSTIMYERIINNYEMDGGVIVNINPQWLFNNIKLINMVDNNSKDLILVLDNNGKLINQLYDDININEEFIMSVENLIDEQHFSNDEIFMVKEKILDHEYLITVLNVYDTGWSLVKTQLYNEVYQSTINMQLTLIWLTGIFLLMAMALSLTLSKRIYKPIGKLIQNIKDKEKNEIDLSKEDEIEFLMRIYRESRKKVLTLESKANITGQILKNYNLRKLLLESSSMSEQERNITVNEISIPVSDFINYSIGILRIDNYSNFNDSYNAEDKDLYKFAIINIMSELLEKLYKNVAVDMKNNVIAFLICIERDDMHEFSEKIKKIIKNSQDYIYEYFKISVTLAIGEPVNNIIELSNLYSNVLDLSEYRIKYGHGSVIFENSNKDTNTEYIYPEKIVKSMIEEINHGRLKETEMILNDIINIISKNNYNYIILSMIHIINDIKAAVVDTNKLKLEPAKIDLTILEKELYQLETIDEFKIKLLNKLNFMNNSQLETSNKHSILIDSVKDMINLNYHDNSIGPQQIAEIFKMNSAYLNRIFKQYTGTSMNDYIVDIRINKAIEYFEKTNYSVTEIVNRVGIVSVSYFYKVFKSRYGVTPKEYIMKKIIDEIQ